jgi:phosphatidylinositol alpha-1,6-mannosyltransferase
VVLLVFSTEFPPGPGGIGTHAHQVSRQLVRAGWTVLVVTPQDYASPEEVAAFNAAQPFEIARLRPVPGAALEGLYRAAVLSRWIRRRRPDVLLATGARAVWVAASVAPTRRQPWLAVGHGGEFGAAGAWERAVGRWAFERATGVVCVSEYTWEAMRSGGIRPRHGRVIPNGADADRFRPLPAEEVRAFRERVGAGESPVLASVGHVTERKGHDVVIRALPRILERVPGARYIVAGLPTRQRELTELARGLGIADHVRFLGRVSEPDVVRLLNACDLFVMPSRHTAEGGFEGYGIAVVEAALCGKPAVVASGSGLTEAIEEGRTGLAVAENDEHETARAIVSLLTDGDRLRRMGAAARERALSEQTWERRAVLYDGFLRSIAAGGTGRGSLPEKDPVAAARS